MLPPIRSLFDPKFVWRERMKGVRADAAENRPDAARHAAATFMSAIDVDDGKIIALYHPIKDELDTAPLAQALDNKGVPLALPVVQQKKSPLVFRRFQPGDPTEDGRYGEAVPVASAETIRPDIIVAPMLAFTGRGDRLGYGGGYYDRTLAALRKTGRVKAVGFAFAAQEVDALPVSPLDQRLDWIVTERSAFRCERD